MNLTVLGGDQRSSKLANMLYNDNHVVKVFGFDKENIKSLEVCENLDLAIIGAKYIIGPVPCSKDNIYLNTPLYSGKIKLEDIFQTMNSEQIFIAGKITNEIKEIANSYKIKTIDLLQREEMAVLNAIPSAEGAIQIAMGETDITLHGSNVIILGFGRIGKILAKMLQGIGANVYVEARKYSDLAWIKSYGYIPVDLNILGDYLKGMDIVFNTVPSMLLNEELLLKLNRESIVIDIASSPGGVDIEKAKELGIKVIWALGLPGKVAATTSGSIIKNTIYNIIEEMGG